MGFFKCFVWYDLVEFYGNNIWVRIIGEWQGFVLDICFFLDEVEQFICFNIGLILVIVFNYGGWQEIVSVVWVLV